MVRKMNVARACEEVHLILEELPKWYEPSNNLPERGIYFFYEEGEISFHTGKLRIVRVGTHGGKRTLRRRLYEHYNGNREGSIFRKYLGAALLKCSGASESVIKEWRKGRKSQYWKEFEETERKVSEILRSKFFFRVIRVDDEKERREFEEKIIATLSACPICRPSHEWLGKLVWNLNVRNSGLWNSNFVNSSRRLTKKDLIRLKQLASLTFFRN